VKKLLLGCAGVLVICAIALGVGAYYLYRAAAPMVENARTMFEGLGQVADLEKNVQDRSSYSAPATGELTKEQVDRFVRVQQHVRSTMGKRIDEIEAKYQYLRDSAKDPSLSELMSSVREMLGLIVEARRAQIDALNKEGFSSSEYSWVRARVYEAAGVELTGAIDFQAIAEAARKGTGFDSIQLPKEPLAGTVPERNRELVKPHMDRMGEFVPLAFFGL
jgi:hypothetical protein